MKNIKLIRQYSLGLLILLFFAKCTKEECTYRGINECIEELILIEDFEGVELESTGSWKWHFLDTLSFVEQRGGSKVFHTIDSSGATWLYNDTDFPSNLAEDACELIYDVELFANDQGVPVTSTNSVSIYIGTDPNSSTFEAKFVLDGSWKILSGDPPKTIRVPLELATGSTLPSNTYGHWEIAGNPGPTYTALEINSFNAAMSGASGLGWFLEEIGFPSPPEQWWFDNFYIQTCCP